MEQEKLLARWHVLLNKPSNVIASLGVLEERLDILHRLFELGKYDIDGLPLIKALEETNVLMRKALWK